MTYPLKTFDLPTLNGISDKQLKVHLALYEGYVKNVNLPTSRFAFEWNGMRLHEYYFAQFEGGPISADAQRQELIAQIKEKAETRGPGWVVVYYDAAAQAPFVVFVHEHELGHLAGLPIILVLDMWEHAYMVDYLPSEKKSYIDAFFANLNWSVVEKRFEDAKKMSPA